MPVNCIQRVIVRLLSFHMYICSRVVSYFLVLQLVPQAIPKLLRLYPEVKVDDEDTVAIGAGKVSNSFESEPRTWRLTMLICGMEKKQVRQRIVRAPGSLSESIPSQRNQKEVFRLFQMISIDFFTSFLRFLRLMSGLPHSPQKDGL